MNGVYTAWGALKRVLNNNGLGINVMKCLHEGVIVPRCTEQRHGILEVLREGK